MKFTSLIAFVSLMFSTFACSKHYGLQSNSTLASDDLFLPSPDWEFDPLPPLDPFTFEYYKFDWGRDVCVEGCITIPGDDFATVPGIYPSLGERSNPGNPSQGSNDSSDPYLSGLAKDAYFYLSQSSRGDVYKPQFTPPNKDDDGAAFRKFQQEMNAEWDQRMESQRRESERASNQQAANQAAAVMTSFTVALLAMTPVNEFQKINEDLAESSQRTKENLTAELENVKHSKFEEQRTSLRKDVENGTQDLAQIESDILNELSSMPTPAISDANSVFKTSAHSVEGQKVRQADLYHKYVQKVSAQFPASYEGKQAADKLLDQSNEIIRSADSAFHGGRGESGDYGIKIANTLLDAAISLAPIAIIAFAPQATALLLTATILSTAKDYYEAKTGKRLFGGESLTSIERGGSWLSVATAVPIAGSLVKSVGLMKKGVESFASLIGIGKSADEIREIGKLVDQTSKQIDGLVAQGVSSGDELVGLVDSNRVLSDLGYKEEVDTLTDLTKDWQRAGKYHAVRHVVAGDVVGSGKNLQGGLHTVLGYDAFIASRPELEPLVDVTLKPNGVRQVLLPREAFNSKGWSDTVDGRKSLFPESWSIRKIVESTNSVLEGKILTGEKQTFEQIVDGVNIRVAVRQGKVISAYPVWE